MHVLIRKILSQNYSNAKTINFKKYKYVEAKSQKLLFELPLYKLLNLTFNHRFCKYTDPWSTLISNTYSY